MRVLMIAPQPVREPRGTPISVSQRLYGLVSLGFRVDLITYHLGEDVDIPGVTIHRIPHIPFIQHVKVGPSWSKVLLDILLFCKAVQMMMLKRYDVIHSHEEAAFFSNVLAAVFRTRHLYDMHSSLPQQLVNFDFGNYRPIIALFRLLERWTIHACDAVITIGSDLEQYVREINPFVEQVMIENLPVQANGTNGHPGNVDTIRQQLDLDGKLAIVYTGTFERYQGIELLIESARIINERREDVVFILVGGKPEQIDTHKASVRRHGLEDVVRFVGTVPVDEVHNYTEVAEILVSPRTEGLSVPLKIYSYLHAGKPIVATDIAAHTLVLDDETAVLVEPTGEALAAGLEVLIADEQLRARLGEQAKALADEKYSFNNYLDRLDQIYQTLAPPTYVSERPAQLLDSRPTRTLEK